MPLRGYGLASALLLLEPLANIGPASITMQAEQPMLYPYRETGTGAASLRARAAALVRRGRPLLVTFRAFRRFDPDTERWTDLALPAPHSSTVPVPSRGRIYSQQTDPVIFTVPDAVGLFWVAWQEDGHPVTALLHAGPILCNDVMLGSPPPGQIATCVPFPDRAVARYIPDPARRLE